MTRPRRSRGPSHGLRRPDSRPPETTRPAGPTTARPSVAPELSRTVMAVAGLDPSGGAGIGADLKTIVAYRHHGAAVITSVTVQNTLGVQAIFDLPPELVAQQIEALVSDMEIHAVKIGMIGTARTAGALARLIESHGLSKVVLDPVLKSTSGTPLLEKGGIPVLREKLIPLAEVVTPNIEEASILTGLRVTDVGSMKEAARQIQHLGARHVIVTGGHLAGRAIDVLYDGSGFAVFDSAKIVSTNTHGIGCTFSTAVACQLARGADMADAVDGAKRYVSRAVAHAGKIGKGPGPLNHLVTPF